MSTATILSLADPVGDLVLIFGIAMLLRATRRSGGIVLPLLLAGCCAFVVGDIGFAYGHGIGDEALSWMAGMCQAVLPSDAVVGRLGGDEFVALLPGHTLHRSLVVADRLVAAVAATVEPVAGGPARISVSLVVASPHDCPDVMSLLRAADGALYQAKRSGRGRACAHPTLETTAPRQAPVPAVT